MNKMDRISATLVGLACCVTGLVLQTNPVSAAALSSIPRPLMVHYVSTGDTVALTCPSTTSREGQPAVSWSFSPVSDDSSPFRVVVVRQNQTTIAGMTSRFHVERHDSSKTYSLLIEDVQPEDAGYYRCTEQDGLTHDSELVLRDVHATTWRTNNDRSTTESMTSQIAALLADRFSRPAGIIFLAVVVFGAFLLVLIGVVWCRRCRSRSSTPFQSFDDHYRADYDSSESLKSVDIVCGGNKSIGYHKINEMRHTDGKELLHC